MTPQFPERGRKNRYKMSSGLYIHIPFCHSRCPYCDFAFVVGKNHLSRRYTDAVITELNNRLPAQTPQLSTIYFGGGTPSAIPPEELNRILNPVKSALISDIEITAEANPNDQAYFKALYQAGINRLSLGVQAFTNPALKTLGRSHSAADAREAFDTARRAGFTNIGIDLIFGAPEQTCDEWATTLHQAIALNPEHISVYGLTVEPNTNFARRHQKRQLPIPEETDQADMYLSAIDHLEDAGYEHYEISNFSRPGFASRHNLNYWREQPYLGIGMSAHSYLNSTRSWNKRDLLTYMESVEKTGLAIEEEETITPPQQLLERVMLGLRQRRGLGVEHLAHPVLHKQYTQLSNRQLLEQTNSHIRLTRKGLLVADLVCTELVKGL